jgi:peptidyl-prolyl cis-trans isomerase C
MRALGWSAMRALGGGLLLAVASSGCLSRAASDPVILALDGQEARRSDFERYLTDLESRQQTAVEPSVREALLHDWLERRVLVLAARSRGLLKPGASSSDERVAVEQFLTAEIGTRVSVGDDEVADYYRQHAAELGRPEEFTLRQILVPTANEARDVQRRLQKDPKSFELLAQAVSRGPEASRGGLMGSFSAGQLPPELETAAFALQPGETSGIVSTSLGQHVLRLEARTPARPLSPDEARDRIRALLLEKKSALVQRDIVAGLMARAKVNHEAAKSTLHIAPS